MAKSAVSGVSAGATTAMQSVASRLDEVRKARARARGAPPALPPL